MVAQEDFGSLQGAREFGSVGVGKARRAQTLGCCLGLRPAPLRQVYGLGGIIVDAVGDIRFALAVADQNIFNFISFRVTNSIAPDKHQGAQRNTDGIQKSGCLNGCVARM